MKTQTTERQTDIDAKGIFHPGNRRHTPSFAWLRFRILAGCTLLATCLTAVPNFAQQNHTIRVGVTVLQNAPVGLSATAARDRLVKDLNKQKKSPVEAVALDHYAGQQLADEARQKNCDFVIYPTLTEAHAQGQDSAGGAFNMMQAQENNVPNFHATIEYQVYRASDLTTVMSGSARAQGIGSQGEIASEALDNIAKKVSSDIRRVAAPAPAATQAPAEAPSSK